MELEKEFLDNINSLYGKDGSEIIVKAFNFAQNKHKGQVIDDGQEYIVHPYNVAKILVDTKADVVSVVSGLLHDCIEDTNCTEQEIKDNFGDVVCNICAGASKV